MLLTATPMQIDPSELWALLQTLDANGQWNEAEFRRFYDIDAQPSLEEWNAARQVYLRDGLPGSAEQIAELARTPVAETREHLDYIRMPASNAVVLRRDMTPERIRGSMSSDAPFIVHQTLSFSSYSQPLCGSMPKRDGSVSPFRSASCTPSRSR